MNSATARHTGPCVVGSRVKCSVSNSTIVLFFSEPGDRYIYNLKNVQSSFQVYFEGVILILSCEIYGKNSRYLLKAHQPFFFF